MRDDADIERETKCLFARCNNAYVSFQILLVAC